MKKVLAVAITASMFAVPAVASAESASAATASKRTITARAFVDANANGKIDAGEKAAARRIVTVLNSKSKVVLKTKTDSNGTFVAKLPAGSYRIKLNTVRGEVPFSAKYQVKKGGMVKLPVKLTKKPVVTKTPAPKIDAPSTLVKTSEVNTYVDQINSLRKKAGLAPVVKADDAVLSTILKHKAYFNTFESSDYVSLHNDVVDSNGKTMAPMYAFGASYLGVISDKPANELPKSVVNNPKITEIVVGMTTDSEGVNVMFVAGIY